MLGLAPQVKIFVCTEPTDMRRSFDGLAMMTETIVKEDPLSGHLFVFINRRRDRLKILWWEGDGAAIYYKRLEEGTFEIPAGENGRVRMKQAELAMLLEGVELKGMRRRRRFQFGVA